MAAVGRSERARGVGPTCRPWQGESQEALGWGLGTDGV